MGLLLKVISIPPVGKMVLEILKKRAFKPFQIPLEKALEKQNRVLKAKFNRMEGTEIGKKLGIYKGVKLQDLPITDYSFYEPFYNNPLPSAFMYPLKDYIRVKTSGTAGKEKWFLLPRRMIIKSFQETAVPMICAIFHDGEKVTLQYGDNLYLNIGPAPFAAGVLATVGSKEGKNPFFNFVPNLNLPYKDKVRYFILNHEKIDAAIMPVSTLISQIMPPIGKPIRLKGLLIPDPPTQVEIYKDEIEKFTGTTPKTAYGSTETLLCSVPSVQYSMGIFFDLRRAIFEFVPLKDGEIKKAESIGINEVAVGEFYRLVYTDLESEITRIDTNSSFECIARGDDFLGIDYPIFKFHCRLDKLISLMNFTRIDENELLKTFKEAGVSFVEFTTRTESEKGLEYLIIYLELVKRTNAEEVEKAIHNQLYETDKDYRDLSDFFEYTPVKVRLVPKGVFNDFLEEKTVAFPKVSRIDMKERDFDMLIQMIKRRTELASRS